jgi:hypothetical protein
MRRSLGQWIEQSHAERHIGLALGSGVMLGTIGLVAGVLGLAARESYAWAALGESAVYFALSYGIRRRSFAAGSAMVLFFALTRIAGGTLSGIIPTVMLGYVFVRAALELRDLRGAAAAGRAGAGPTG